MTQSTSSVRGSGSVLLIDDDPQVRAMMRARLEARNFRVVEATTGEDGLQMVGGDIDVVIVDVGLPGIDGFTVVRAIRERHDMPIIMVTGADEEADRVLGLEIGADDYVVKPFLPRELVARVHAVLRRTAAQPSNEVVEDHVITVGDLEIDGHAMVARRDGATLPLTNREFDLLHFLARSPRQAFTREQLLRHVWHTEPGWQDPSTVTEHIHRLRRHVEVDPANPKHLVTVRGVGYRFDL
jgi:two-component system, OmpR family, phosphate regulon response regulator PhoB